VRAAFDSGTGDTRSRPTGNFRFALIAAQEVLLHEGPVAFLRLAVDKLKRIRARG